VLDWLIVGGGVHGTLLSRALVEEAGVPRDRVQVIDPQDEPLARFREHAAATGLDVLRSSVVHHLDSDPMSLRRFAERHRRVGELHGIYQRPGMALFASHCDHVMDRCGLRALRVRGEATDLVERPSGLAVETTAGALLARRVVLAVGTADQPLWPAWAEMLRDSGGAVRHVFDPGFRLDELLHWEDPIVLGGGLSAVQVALWLGARRPGAVTLLTRHAVRVHEFDADSPWMGPRGARTFARIAGKGERRATIGRERHRGSVPAEFARALERARREGAIVVVQDDVASASAPVGGGVELELCSGGGLRGGGLVLATGFHPRRPGGPWLDRTMDRLGLEYAACGYPVVDASLRWAPGIYVTGPLAELEVGPVARNILGARMAGQRLVAVARG
jgi:cation diffusion facilitator CzcD-associated flavoprotein CzcO